MSASADASPPPSHTASATPPSRWWDLTTALLLLAALFAAASRLVVTGWTDNLSLAQILVVLGGLVGLALGQSCFSPRLSATFALAYGMFAIPWQFGLTVGYISPDVAWNDRLVSLTVRLLNALGQMARREAVRDPLLFLFSMAILFWTLGAHAGYTLTRCAHPWRVILPSGLALIVIHATDPYVASRAWYLAVYLFFSLLLLAYLTYLRCRAHWQQTRAHVPPLIILDFTSVILVSTVLLILLAWTVPAMADALPAVRKAWRQTVRPWWDATRESMDSAFASLRRPAVVTVADYYGESLFLDRGGELSDALVMTVQSPSRSGVGMRYYWRARVYDHYADGQWSNVAFSTVRPLDPTGSGLTFPELEGRRTITFTFTSAVPIATLYTAPQPRWVSRPAKADLAGNPDGSADLSALHATPPLHAGETYQARSSLSSATVAQLREAGADYSRRGIGSYGTMPQWISDRYLQLPTTVTPRTHELAQQIAADLDNPYDIAVAVTGYLRTHIQYTEIITPPIPDQEPLDWFLFDLREGFCNYYASAEVILLRSLDIPARLAVGFAQGERQAGSNTYLVRQHNSHAWPEVYFPGLGWIEFEPTVSQSSIHRPLGEDANGGAGGATPGESDRREFWEDRLNRLEELLALEESIPEPAAADPRATATTWAVSLGLGLGLIALVWRQRRRRGMPPLPVLLEKSLRRFDLQPPAILRRWALYATTSPLAYAYLELNHALVRLGAPPTPADTPAERATALTNLLPAAADPAQQLVAEYHDMAYSPRFGNLYNARQAARAIRKLSWQARVRQLVAR